MGVGVLLDQAGRHAVGRGARRREVDGHGAREGLDAGLGRGRGRETSAGRAHRRGRRRTTRRPGGRRRRPSPATAWRLSPIRRRPRSWPTGSRPRRRGRACRWRGGRRSPRRSPRRRAGRRRPRSRRPGGARCRAWRDRPRRPAPCRRHRRTAWATFSAPARVLRACSAMAVSGAARARAVAAPMPDEAPVMRMARVMSVPVGGSETQSLLPRGSRK